MDTIVPIPSPESIVQRWQIALQQREPTLPRPIVDAMIQNAMKGSYGESLRQLEEALIRLEMSDPNQVTGSEARTWLAILVHMRQLSEDIEARLLKLWSSA